MSNTLDEISNNLKKSETAFLNHIHWLERVPSGIPIKGQYAITSRFGIRIDPFTHFPARHEGIDFQAATGTEIIASASGKVRKAAWDAELGNMIILEHPEGLTSKYSHAQKLFVTEGQTVNRGEVIALVGGTGRATAPHLHFEVHRNGILENPERYLGSNLNVLKQSIAKDFSRT